MKVSAISLLPNYFGHLVFTVTVICSYSFLYKDLNIYFCYSICVFAVASLWYCWFILWPKRQLRWMWLMITLHFCQTSKSSRCCVRCTFIDVQIPGCSSWRRCPTRRCATWSGRRAGSRLRNRWRRSRGPWRRSRWRRPSAFSCWTTDRRPPLHWVFSSRRSTNV